MFSLKNFFKKIDSSAGLRLALGSLLALTLALSVVGYVSVARIADDSQHALRFNAAAAGRALQVAGNVADLRRFEKDVFLNIASETKVIEYQKKWEAKYKEASANLEQLRPLVADGDGKNQVEIMSKQLLAYDAGFHAVLGKIRTESLQRPELGNEAILPFKDGIRALEESAAALAGHETQDMATVPETLGSQASFAKLLVALGSVLALGIGAVISRIVAKNVGATRVALEETRQLKDKIQRDNDDLQGNIMDLLQVVSDASEGNLTVRAQITANALGNVADAFNSLLEAQQGILSDVYQQVAKTTSAVQEIERASREMASGATNQASGVQIAQELVQKMSAEIGKVSEGAARAVAAAKRTEESAVEGTTVVQNVISGMGTLRANVQAGAKKMKNLGDRSMEITGIVATINGISERTNLLALNAAIEAARAGEHGRGFSVVAEEVRKLAERTAAATQEIGRLVQAIHVETNETVGAIEQQTHVVEQESALVGQAGESLVRIRQVSAESASVVVDISRVAQVQAKETTSVVQTMDQISAIARSTQTGAEATVATIMQLSELSERLRGSIQRFKVA
jgi:methyl-accepting chemotaxis protein